MTFDLMIDGLAANCTTESFLFWVKQSLVSLRGKCTAVSLPVHSMCDPPAASGRAAPAVGGSSAGG